jgi:hypothetical protein
LGTQLSLKLCFNRVAAKATATKRSFADIGIPKLELGNEAATVAK